MRTLLVYGVVALITLSAGRTVLAQEVSLMPEGEQLAGDTNYIPFVLAGAGVVSILMGGLFALLASGEYDSARDAASGTDAADAISSGDTFATTGNLLFVLGGVLTLSGLAWAGAEVKTGASFGIGPGSVSLSGTFN